MLEEKFKIAVLCGDGIGQEVTESALPLFEALSTKVELVFADIGWECWRKGGNPVPAPTWEVIKKTDATLLGAITSKDLHSAIAELPMEMRANPPDYVSPVVQLRQKLSLFANIRPIFNIDFRTKPFSCVIIRENTEGLYSGLDYASLPDELKLLIKKNAKWSVHPLEKASCSLRLQTEEGLLRLYQFAFDYAEKNGFSTVTLADKQNVLRYSGHFAKEIFESVASGYKNIQHEIINVDAIGMWLIQRPEKFGVIVAENMFGDILSDVGAGVMGGLGFAPSMNVGKNYSYFEPVHGSAPRLAGKNKANPTAMFLTIALMLDHLNQKNYFNTVKKAIYSVIKEARFLTYDLGGQATTTDMANAILDKIYAPTTTKSITLLSTGNELVNGEYLDTNSQYFAKKLVECGMEINSQQIVIDNKKKIEAALRFHLADNDCILLCGGLGPTSDDHTRFAVATAINKELFFDDTTWKNICYRLKSFGITIHPDNKKQALFPQAAEIIPNPNGTAAGCKIIFDDKLIFLLPGPPNECRPMFDKYVLPYLSSKNYASNKKTITIKLIGVIEADVASEVDKLANKYQLQASYCWSYPYLDIKISYQNVGLIHTFEKMFEQKFQPFIVSKNGKDAIVLLDELLEKTFINLKIIDRLTENRFKSLFKEYTYLDEEAPSEISHNLDESAVYVITKGAEQFKQAGSYSGSIDFNCSILTKEKQIDKKISVPYRGPEVADYALHFMCFSIFTSLTELGI